MELAVAAAVVRYKRANRVVSSAVAVRCLSARLQLDRHLGLLRGRRSKIAKLAAVLWQLVANEGDVDVIDLICLEMASYHCRFPVKVVASFHRCVLVASRKVAPFLAHVLAHHLYIAIEVVQARVGHVVSTIPGVVPHARISFYLGVLISRNGVPTELVEKIVASHDRRLIETYAFLMYSPGIV